jgi:hypothetical protein
MDSGAFKHEVHHETTIDDDDLRRFPVPHRSQASYPGRKVHELRVFSATSAQIPGIFTISVPSKMSADKIIEKSF